LGVLLIVAPLVNADGVNPHFESQVSCVLADIMKAGPEVWPHVELVAI
jgi:hypothetical protein